MSKNPRQESKTSNMGPPSLTHHPSSSTSASTIKPPYDTKASSSPAPFIRPYSRPASSPTPPLPAQRTPNVVKDTPLFYPHQPHPPSSSQSSPGPDHGKLALPPHSHPVGESRSSSVPRRGRRGSHSSPGPAAPSALARASPTRTPKGHDGYETDSERDGAAPKVRTMSAGRSDSPGRKWLVRDEAHALASQLQVFDSDDEQEGAGGLSGSSLWGYFENKRKATSALTPEQAESLVVTREHVAKTVLALLTPEAIKRLANHSTAAASTPKAKGKERLKKAVDTSVDIAHEVLTVSVDALEFAPIPGLAAGARLLLGMWDSCGQVDTNSLACLRLTQRSADILLAVRDEVALAGDKVTAELEQPILRLVEAFTQINNFLLKQTRRPFLKRYLKRDEILTQIQDCDKVLSDVMSIFGISIQMRMLRQMQEAEEARRQDTERLIESVLAAQQRNRLPSLGQTGNSLLLGPPPGTPPQGGTAPYAHESRPSAIDLLDFQQEQVKNLSPPTKTSELPQTDEPVKFPEGPDYVPYGYDPLWAIQLPLPPHQSPRSPFQELLTVDDATSSPRTKIRRIQTSQNLLDAQADQQHLRSVLRTALGKGGEAEIISILQVRQDEMPEAIKALQRALERINDGDAPSVILPSIRRRSTTSSRRMSGSRAADALSRVDSFKGAEDRSSTSDVSQVVVEEAPTMLKADSLDREFIETGIDALRRRSQSSGVAVSCPSWTITKYEISQQALIGVGSFSDVYRGTYRSQSVAIKILSRATPRSLFVREVSIWKKLRHGHVLELIGASSATSDPPWFLVSPYMKNGSLVSFLKEEETHLTEPDLLKVLHQIAKGMEYLHAKGVLHGDLKAANVLVDDQQRCVITDFGQSEMKSEAYRLSGAKRPHGTLQWQAPELLAGANRLTTEMDVFAFAMCCIEVLTFGQLPWGHLTSDDTVRAYITVEHRRPEILTSNTSLRELITQCWDQDPFERPRFSRIVKDLKRLRLESGQTVSEEPSLPFLTFEEPNTSHPSPDMRPAKLPLEPTSPDSDTSSYLTAEGSMPSSPRALRRQDHRHVGSLLQSPRRATFGEPSAPVVQRDVPLPYVSVNSSQHSLVGESHDTTTTTASTTDDDDDDIGVPLLRRLGSQESERSPPPANEAIAAAKNERRYRLLLQHDYHQSLRLPLWRPGPVSLGDVGYLSKPAGAFVTLFNCFDPTKTSNGRISGMASVYGYAQDNKVNTGSHKEDKLNAVQRGLFSAFAGMFPFRSKVTNSPTHVSRRYSYLLRAGHKAAYLCTEATVYRYIEELDAPKSWFKANVDTILKLYSAEHHITREDLYLVIGTLEAADHAQFVSHKHPDGHAHFNVFSAPRAGQAWGSFTTDSNTSSVDKVGPSYPEETLANPKSASRISSAGGPPDAVLVARLRFPTDALEPTSM